MPANSRYDVEMKHRDNPRQRTWRQVIAADPEMAKRIARMAWPDWLPVIARRIAGERPGAVA